MYDILGGCLFMGVVWLFLFNYIIKVHYFADYQIHIVTHLIQKEENVLFNSILNTFYLWHWAYGTGPFRQQEGKPAAATTLGFFICTRIAHTTAFVNPVMEHWLEQEIVQWVHHGASHHEQTLYHGTTSVTFTFLE